MSINKKILNAIISICMVLAIALTSITIISLIIGKNNTLNVQNYNSQKLSEENTMLLKENNKINVDNLVESYAQDINNQLSNYSVIINLFKNYIEDLYLKEDIVPSNYSSINDFGCGLLADTKFSDVGEEVRKIKPMLDLSNSIVGWTDPNKAYDIDPDGWNQACYYYVSASGFMLSNMMVVSEFNGWFDRRERDWYINSVKAGKMIWSTPYKDLRLDTNVITCSIPVYKNNGEIAGVFGADIAIDAMCRSVLKVDHSVMDFSFLLDENDNFFLGSEENTTLQEFISNDEIMDALYKDIKEAHERNISPNDFDKDKIVVGTANVEETGWQVGIILNYDKVMGSADIVKQKIEENNKLTNSNVNQMILVVAMCCVVITVIVFIIIQQVSKKVSNKITQPIDVLIEGTQVISKGELDHKIFIKSNDEMEQLANSFNYMTQELKEYVENITKITIEKEKIHGELNVAKKIQESMLPSIFPAFPKREEFDIYANMDPAKEVGGDFYDFFFMDDDHIAMLIADVSGKGVAAALFMVVAKTLLKNEAQNGGSIEKVLESVNKKLCETNEEGMFVTAFAAVFNIKTAELAYANAGHNVPLIYRSKNKKFEWMKTSHGFVLAGIDTVKYKIEKTYLAKGDILYLYTDGVTECMNNQNELFSEQTLYDTLNNMEVETMSLKNILDKIRENLDAFAQGAPRSDDITMLIFRNKNI